MGSRSKCLACVAMVAAISLAMVGCSVNGSDTDGGSSGSEAAVEADPGRGGEDVVAAPADEGAAPAREYWSRGEISRRGKIAGQMAVSPPVVAPGGKLRAMLINRGEVAFSYGFGFEVDRKVGPCSQGDELSARERCERGMLWQRVGRRAIARPYRSIRLPLLFVGPGLAAGPDLGGGEDARVLALSLDPGQYRVRRTVAPEHGHVERAPDDDRPLRLTAPFRVEGPAPGSLRPQELFAGDVERRNGRMAGRLSLGDERAEPGDQVALNIANTGGVRMSDFGRTMLRRWNGGHWGSTGAHSGPSLLDGDIGLSIDAGKSHESHSLRLPNRLRPGRYLVTRIVEADPTRGQRRIVNLDAKLALTAEIEIYSAQEGNGDPKRAIRPGVGPVVRDRGAAGRLLLESGYVRPGGELAVSVQNLGRKTFLYGLTGDLSRREHGRWQPVSAEQWSMPIKSDVIPGVRPGERVEPDQNGAENDRWPVPVDLEPGHYRLQRWASGVGNPRRAPRLRLSVAFRVLAAVG